jgi:2-phospho-L-lactate guanylyltransferase
MKSPGTGKTRLDGHFSVGERAALAGAMFSDVLIALSRATKLSGVLVVSADADVARTAGLHNADWINDEDAASHSEAAGLGIAHAVAAGAKRVLLVPGDCPAITADEIDALAARDIGENAVAVLADRHGTGTNGLLMTPPDVITPSFGPGSRDRHISLAEQAGATGLVVESPGFLMDVDTPEDLDSLASHLETIRGAAANTRGILAQRKLLASG